MALGIGKERVDNELALEGVWVNIAWTDRGYVWWLEGEPRPVSEDTVSGMVRVARAGNQRAKEYSKKALKPYRRVRQQLGEYPDEVWEKVLNGTLAHAILTDWKDIEVGGKKKKYTPEAGLEVFDADPEFRSAITDISREFQLYRDEGIREDGEALGNA